MRNIEKIQNWLQNTPYEGVFLGRRDNYKWVTEEDENAVVTNTEVGIAFLLIHKNGSIQLFADSSDCPRMEAEQNALGASCVLVPWYETLGGYLEAYCKERRDAGEYASDTGFAYTECVEEEMVQLRMQLSAKEKDRYRQIGQECAEIVEQTTREIRPGQTEQEVAAILKSRCLASGISPDCVLVGSDERILDYRHPVPSNKAIQKSAMVVLGGEKYGLNISMTRFIYFEEPSDAIRERMVKTQYIFACMQGMMKDGMSYQEYFDQVMLLYKGAGYEEEWKMHHQGGPTGYGCREFVVTPDTAGSLRKNQAYAWNPTIQGTKCEETTILGKAGVEILTQTEAWPRVEVETPYGTCSVADILVKN